jgi:hypothetical protein
MRSADGIERLLLDPDHAPAADARNEALLARLRAAAQQLSRIEARQLAEHIHAACNSARGADLTTSAAGLFLLIRPLLDLRLPAAMNAAGLDAAAAHTFLFDIGEAAGIASDDAGLAVFATGDSAASGRVRFEAAQRGALYPMLRSNAERLGLNTMAESLSPEQFALNLACQQLVRWLHGFEKSSLEFVLRTLVHKHGTLVLRAGEPLTVVWPGSALDLLLDRVGFLDPLATVPWWNGRGLVWLR